MVEVGVATVAHRGVAATEEVVVTVVGVATAEVGVDMVEVGVDATKPILPVRCNQGGKRYYCDDDRYMKVKGEWMGFLQYTCML